MPDDEKGKNPVDEPTGDEKSQVGSEPVITPETPVDIDSLPVNVQHLIRITRDEAAQNRVKADKLREEMDRARDEELAEQKKWEELAAKRAKRIEELESIAERADEYEERLLRVMRQRVESWPDEIKAMMPAGSDPTALEEFISKAQPLVDKMRTDAKAPKGVGEPPRPSGGPGGPSQEAQKRQRAGFENWVRGL